MTATKQVTRQQPTLRTFTIDAGHSSAEFAVKHLMIATVKGSLRISKGTIQHDASDPSQTRIMADLDAASIQTGDAQRDAHLRSPDFLDAAQFPTLRFVSTSVEGDDAAWRVHGELTIRGVTKPVTLEVEKDGEADDPWGKHRAAVTASATIDRTAWGLTWNKALEAGGLLVGDKVKVQLHLSLVESKE